MASWDLEDMKRAIVSELLGGRHISEFLERRVELLAIRSDAP